MVCYTYFIKSQSMGAVSGTIVNSGSIFGDCTIDNKNTYIYIVMKDNEELKETLNILNELMKSQQVLSDAMLKQRNIDDKHADALLSLARAAENNSLANLNISKAIVEDKNKIDSNLLQKFFDLIESQKLK